MGHIELLFCISHIVQNDNVENIQNDFHDP